MPKAGFKTITVTETVYDVFYQTWLKCKDELAAKDVTSFAAYITYLIEEIMEEKRIFAKYQQVFTKISIEGDRLIIHDHKLDRIIELSNDKGNLLCLHCERDDCVHVGFCWSFHQIYD